MGEKIWEKSELCKESLHLVTATEKQYEN